MMAALGFRGAIGRGIYRCFAAGSHGLRVAVNSSAATSHSKEIAGQEAAQLLGVQPEAGVVSLAYAAAAFLAKVRAVVPAKFLKTADNIHCHKKLLSNTLLNNLCLHDMLSRGLEAADSTVGIYGSPPLFALDRIRNANGAVQLMQRTAAMNGLAQAFTRRASLRTKSGSSGAVSRLCNPLVAFSGAPGGGKTAVLELAAELTSEQMWSAELCPDPVMRANLNASIAVTVTYNSGMDANVETYDEDPELGLALRMLYSALVIDAPEVYSFEEFWLGWSNLAMSPQIRLTLQLAVVACMQALSELAPSRAGMLLLVDEPRKLAKEFQSISGSDILADSNGVYKMIGALSRALDSNRSEVFNVALTTLDSLMLQAVSTASGRTIDWVGLDGLRQHEAEAMIMCALGRRSAPGAPVPALVALSVADCARHPRTLESLSQALVQRASEHVGCPDWFHKSGELSHIRREVFSSCGVGVAPLWAIRAALRGIALPYDAVIEGSGGTTFGDAIAKGVFLNTVEADTVTTVRIPRLSFMHLLKAAARELSVPVRKAINCMAVQEQVVFDNPRKSGAMQFGGSGFEGFVLHWLMLRFGLAAASGDGRGLSLEELFALDPGLADCGARVCDPRMTTGTPSHPLRFRHVPLADVSFADAAKSRGRINKVIADGGGVVTFIENNPAFDILLLVREVVKGVPVPGVAALPPLAIAIEARFSNLKSVVRTTAEEVSRKVELFNAQRGTFDALGIPADRVTYVIMASRLDGPVDSESAQLPHDPDSSLRLSSSDRGLTADEKAAFLEQGVLVLDRAGVERALTPTLVDRAFFLLSSSDFEGRRADINL